MVEVNLELLLQLNSKLDWINNIPKKLPVKKHIGESFIFLDKLGNFLIIGEDFHAAEKLNTYPVKVYRKIRVVDQL